MNTNPKLDPNVAARNSWKCMRLRCNYKSHTSYQQYGGRGIKVCERWKLFRNFLEDMGPRPSPLHSLDRIDVNGDYTPENCRWATEQDQYNNRRRVSNTGVRGVSLSKDPKHAAKPYYAYTCIAGRMKSVGKFETLEEARLAREAAQPLQLAARQKQLNGEQ